MSASGPPNPDARTWPLVGVGWYDGRAQAMHRHSEGQLIYPLAGMLTITTRIGTWVAASNRVAWTPPGFEHSHRAPARTHVAAVAVRPELGVQLPDRPCVLGVSGLLREAITVLAENRPMRSTARRHLEAVLIDALMDAPREAMYLPEARDDRLRSLTTLVRQELANPRTLSDLGTEVGASARTLSRLFRDELGMGFHQWRTQLRVQHALVLLWEGRSVSETAAMCGWANPSSFVAAFRNVVGNTPGQYQAGRAAAV